MIVISPMKTWVVEILEERENNPNTSNNKMPYIIMSSGAKVLKSTAGQKTKKEVLDNVKEIVKTNQKAWRNGCIITNQIDANLNYSAGNTIIGKDFFGQTIEIVEEKGRNIPPPIIESINIDTNSTNNTLKFTTIVVQCFSLKQFEMFELFFCKPGMHVLIEYGEGSQQSLLNSDVFVPKNNYDGFIENFIDYTKPDKQSFAKYHNICKTSKGTYDRCAGRVTDYSYTIDKDGTYIVNITMTQGNEFNFALPRSFEAKQRLVASPSSNLTEFEQIVEKIKNDFTGLDTTMKIPENYWKNDIFNFIKKTDFNKDSHTSSIPYISLKFVLSILMNNYISQGGTTIDFIFDIPNFFEIDDKSEQIIPITVHKNIISSNDFCIFPNEETPLFNIVDGEIKTGAFSIDGRINGKSIIEKRDVYYTPDGIEKTKIIPSFSENTSNNDFRIGNALNIFLNYEFIGELWERNYSKIDFLVDVLDHINKYAYGMFELRYGNLRELSKATVIDAKLKVLNNAIIKTEPNYRKEYRFKPTTLKSNVRDFKFIFTMSNVLAAQTMLNNGRFLASIKYKDENNKEDLLQIATNNYVFQSIDYSNFSTADGYYAINQIEYSQLKNVTPAGTTFTNGTKDISNEELKTNLNSKSIKFKTGFDGMTSSNIPGGFTSGINTTETNSNWPTLIFKDAGFITKNVLKLTDPNTKKDYELLTSNEVTIIIDGISGITCGETFRIDGVPEQFNRLGVFQIINTKHNIDKQNGWTTELVARYNPYGS